MDATTFRTRSVIPMVSTLGGFLLYYHEHMKWKVKVGAKLGIRQ